MKFRKDITDFLLFYENRYEHFEFRMYEQDNIVYVANYDGNDVEKILYFSDCHCYFGESDKYILLEIEAFIVLI